MVKLARQMNEVSDTVTRLADALTVIDAKIDRIRVGEPGVHELEYTFSDITRTVAHVDVSGLLSHDFRVHFLGFTNTIASIFYATFGNRSPQDTADLIGDILNIHINFASIPRIWSSMSVRTLIQACSRLRIREWICKSRGIPYPNAVVDQEVQHSTFLHVRAFYSIISHTRRVWEDRGYDGDASLVNIVDCFMGKFGEDLVCYDVDDEIEYAYGARHPRRREIPAVTGGGQTTLDGFVAPTRKRMADEMEEGLLPPQSRRRY